MKILLWHGEKHKDATVTEIPVTPTITAYNMIREWQRVGMIPLPQEHGNTLYIPWHRVNYIEVRA